MIKKGDLVLPIEEREYMFLILVEKDPRT